MALDKPYLKDDGTATTSVTLAATTGAILRLATTPAPITLKVSVSGSAVTLSWSGMASASTDVFRNNRRLATVANSGSYADTLPKNAKSSYSYRVGAAGTSTCSASVSVTVGAGTQYTTLGAPQARSSFKHRYSRFFLRARASARRDRRLPR